jgi:hypothetical protein
MGSREVIGMGDDAAVLAPEIAFVIDDHRVDERVPGPNLRFEEPECIVGPLPQGADTSHDVSK